MSFCCTRFITAMWLSISRNWIHWVSDCAKQIFSWFLSFSYDVLSCHVVFNWWKQLRMRIAVGTLWSPHNVSNYQRTRWPEGDLKYWVLCSWLLNRESSCDWIFETTTTPQVVLVGAHCKFSCAISEPAHDCKLQQSQIRSLIAEIHMHWHSAPPPTHSSTP